MIELLDIIKHILEEEGIKVYWHENFIEHTAVATIRPHPNELAVILDLHLPYIWVRETSFGIVTKHTSHSWRPTDPHCIDEFTFNVIAMFPSKWDDDVSEDNRSNNYGHC
jgi:hypothetical protein